MKIHERRHPLYERFIDDWIFYQESYDGGDEYVSKHLSTHRLENADDYGRRKARAYYLNYCAPICSIPSDYVFKKEATRPADDNLTIIRENIDHKKTNIHEFMRRVATLSSIYGQVHIIIDRTKPTEVIREEIKKGRTTKSDVIALPPYATIIHPQNLLDWSMDVASQSLNWILIFETVYKDSDFTQERVAVPLYKIWTKEKWIVFDEDDNILDEGDHGLGFVPLVTCYHKDLDYDLVGESMLSGVAETNKTVFNWCSDIDEMISRQTFSQLICPDDGSMLAEEVDDQGRSAALRKVGTSTIFTYPADAKHAPAFISPDTEQVEKIWDMIERHVLEMFRMSGLVSAKSSLIQLQQRTGKAQEFEFLDMAVFFAAKAKNLETTENKMNEYFYAWLNAKGKPERVHYPEKFDIVSSAEIVDLFTKVHLNNISGTLNKEMAKRLVHQVLPHAEDETIATIYAEIEENEILEDPTLLTEPKNETQNPPSKESKGEEEKEEKEETKVTKKKEPVPNASKPERKAKFREKHVS